MNLFLELSKKMKFKKNPSFAFLSRNIPIFYILNIVKPNLEIVCQPRAGWLDKYNTYLEILNLQGNALRDRWNHYVKSKANVKSLA